MSTVERDLWQMLIQERCGLQFSGGRLGMLRRRLWKRMQVHQIQSYSDYYHFVTFNSDGHAEWQVLQALLLNHETSFFRHPAALEALTGHLLPAVVERKAHQDGRLIKLWSVACSTGQEPYSLAMATLEWLATSSVRNGQPGWQIKISASDISREALQKAKKGHYKRHELRYLPDIYRRRYIQQVGDTYHVTADVQTLVQFGYANLLEPTTFWVVEQDVIFCQNVLIYFNPEDRRKIVSHLLERLALGGYLIITPATTEGLQDKGVHRMSLPDVLVYQKISNLRQFQDLNDPKVG